MALGKMEDRSKSVEEREDIRFITTDSATCGNYAFLF